MNMQVSKVYFNSLAYLQIDLRGKAIAIVPFLKVNDRAFGQDASRIDLRHTHIIATLDVI
jgi:hypothetical protein